MSSIQGAVPPSAAKKLEASASKGVNPKRSLIVQRLPAEYRETLLAASAVSSLLHPIPQPFHGVPHSSSDPLSLEEKKEASDQQANPLLHPDQTLLKKKKKTKASSKQPLIESSFSSSSSSSRNTPLRLVHRTDNMIERDRSDVLNTDVEMDLDEIDPIFKEYRIRQDQIESNTPYELEHEVYTPITRRSFYKFIDETYSKKFGIEAKEDKPIDENACQAIEASKRQGKIEAFSYQKFIKEYMRQASPFRGLLVYHGLGSGKTCSAIAAAEAIYGNSNKKIIVMTPFSLRPNFISEITFCGFKHFNVNNHWVRQPLSTEYESTPVYMFALEILSLPEEYLNGVLRRSEEERKVIWIPDFDKPSNYYDESQISPQERNDIRQQIMTAIENRITFISYNGITAAKLKEYACSTDEDGNKFFDNAVIVIDEFHNLIRLMQGNIESYIRKRHGRQRKIAVEPIVPGRWKPSLCDRPLNYKRAYLFYRLLSDARNSKIIGLSGTPIINFPEELGILANVLGGYMECVEFIINNKDVDDLESIRELCEEEIRVDMVRYEIMDQKTKFLVSVFQEGYVREDTTDEKGEPYVGVRYTEDEDGQETIQVVYARIKREIEEAGSYGTIQSEAFISYPRLPVDEETFRKEFINPVDLSIRNRLVLQKRITGLISYYAASNEAFMPRVTKDELVRCEMSDYVLNMYTQARKEEIEGEANKKKEPGDVFSAVEMFAKMKNPSSYRFRSRALCNFAFPKSIDRPFPGTKVDEEEADKEMIGEADLQEIIEQSSADVVNDQRMVQEVMEEEEQTEDPDVIDPSDVSSAMTIPIGAEEVKQEGGAGEEKQEAPMIVPAAKKLVTATQVRARLEALRAAKASLESAQAAPSAPALAAPSALAPSAALAPLAPSVPKTKIIGIKKPVSADKVGIVSDQPVPASSVPASSVPASSVSAPSVSAKTKIIGIKKPVSADKVDVISDQPAPVPSVSKTKIIGIKKPVSADKVEVVSEQEPPATVIKKVFDQPRSASSVIGIKSAKKSLSKPVSDEKQAEESEEAEAEEEDEIPPEMISSMMALMQKKLDDIKEEEAEVSTASTASTASTSKSKIIGIKKPGSVAPVSIAPVSIAPVSIAPVSAAPVSAAPVSVKQKLVGIKKPISADKVSSLPVAPIQPLPDVAEEEKEKEKEPEPEIGSESEIPARRYIPYKDLIRIAMDKLNKNRDIFLKLDSMNEEGRLSNYSNKLDRMLRNLNESKGSNLVYSQFKTVEGLGVLGLALKANGYSEIVVQGSDQDPYFSPATVESFSKGPQSGEKRFILFTGEGSKDRRALILNIFNGNIDKLPTKIQDVFVKGKFVDDQNKRGAICWVIGITGAGAEGISLKCCRSVHIMESYWNNVRLDQVKGRAIRICSHTDLPYAERTVDIYTYCSVFSEDQKRSKLDAIIKANDNNETSDERVYNVSIKKDKINQEILQVMKSAAVDCGLNSADLDNVQCLYIDGPADQYLFDPDLEVDKRITGIQFKKFIEAQQASAPSAPSAPSASSAPSATEAAIQAVSIATGKVAPSSIAPKTKVPKMRVKKFQLDGNSYLLLPYSPNDMERFKVYLATDNLFRRQLGELELDPLTGTPSRFFLYP